MAELIQHKNAAARLLYYIERAAGKNSNVPFVDLWAELLGISSTLVPGRKDHDVAELLKAFLGQLDAVQAALLAQGVPEELVVNPIQRVANVMALQYINTPWSQLAGQFSPDVRVSFRWFVHVLPADVQTMDVEAFEELYTLLEELKELTQQEALPPALRSYLTRVLADIRTAMSFVPVSGLWPLRNAVRKTVMDATVESDHLKEVLEKAPPETARKATAVIGKILKRGAEASGDVEKLVKLLKYGGDAIAWLEKNVPWPGIGS